MEMKEVLAVSSDKKEKVEDMLKKDEEINRGSIVVKSASSLGFDDDCYFIIIDAPEHAIKKALNMVSGIASVFKDKNRVLKKYEEQEEAAMQGFGSIMGD